MTQVTLSATRHKKWRQCQALYGYEYLEKRKPVANQGAQLGKRGHKIMEMHYQGHPIPMDETVQVVERNGTLTDVRIGLVVSAGLHLLPPAPQPTLNLEKEIELNIKGYKWTGFVDLSVTGPGPWLVYDFKFTKDLRYAQTPHQLADDPQGTIYATWAMEQSDLPVVDLAWVYFRTRGEPKAQRTRLTVLQDQVVSRWDDLLKDADGIHEAHAHGDVSRLQKNYMACSDYGGCPHATYCLKGKDSMPKFDELIAAKQNPAATPPTIMEPVPPPPVVEEIPAPVPPPPVVEVVYFDPKTANRDQLKAELMRLGKIDQSCKLGEAKLREMLLDGITPTPTPRPSARATSVPQPVDALPPPPPVPADAEPEAPPAPIQAGLSLYIDCFPVFGTGEEVMSGAKFLADVYDMAAQSLKVPDAKLADFGKGAGAIRAMTKSYLEVHREALNGKALVISSIGNADAIPVLEAYAARIVRGTR